MHSAYHAKITDRCPSCGLSYNSTLQGTQDQTIAQEDHVMPTPIDALCLSKSSASTVRQDRKDSNTADHNNKPGISESILPEPLTLKLLYYLIGTLNQVFPDHDFTEVNPARFIHHPDLRVVVDDINNKLAPICTPNLLKRLWDVVDTQIGIADCLVFSYCADAIPDVLSSNQVHSDPSLNLVPDQSNVIFSEASATPPLLEYEVDDPFWDDGCL
jgi:hypothetical protein